MSSKRNPIAKALQRKPQQVIPDKRHATQVSYRAVMEVIREERGTAHDIFVLAESRCLTENEACENAADFCHMYGGCEFCVEWATAVVSGKATDDDD